MVVEYHLLTMLIFKLEDGRVSDDYHVIERMLVFNEAEPSLLYDAKIKAKLL